LFIAKRFVARTLRWHQSVYIGQHPPTESSLNVVPELLRIAAALIEYPKRTAEPKLLPNKHRSGWPSRLSRYETPRSVAVVS
jgi:hypothetical protein